MDRDLENPILEQMRALVTREAPMAELFLFGSRARGDSASISDWDLLLLLNHEPLSFEQETRWMDAFYELELRTGEVISPLIYSKADWYGRHRQTRLFQNVQKEAIRIL